MMIAEMVEELGHRVVAQAGSISDAQEFARSAEFDLAILDVNVGGDDILPIARVIDKRALPFVLASGYGTTGLPAPFRDRPVLRKPFLEQLSAAIDTLFGSKPGDI
ncbi:response regulator [Bradyrhizobium sp. ORS 111]|uniref:response regulator n=1 Tax=Bradyrhizobium sp. ORS 111 TaxID=1685958 RepID=UPI00389109D4